MNAKTLTLFTRTPLHVGAGSSVGAIDLPVVRERATNLPVIPGSSLKGVLADLWADQLDNKKTRQQGSDLETLFGVDRDPKNPQSGRLLIGESRLLAFPVRSAKGGFAWLVCPLTLGRLKRDRHLSYTCPDDLEADECYAPSRLQLADDVKKVVLEEYALEVKGDIDQSITEALQTISDDALWQEEMASHLVLVSDEMFAYFAANACEIAQHVKIDDETGTAKNGDLFNQENVPSETMFYTTVHELKDGLIEKLAAKLKDNGNLIQVGADATTGLGWCSTTLTQID